jgi:hypothetical protein
MWRALQSGIEVRMGDRRPDCGDERPYRVVMAQDESGADMPAIVAMRQRDGTPDEEILLGVEDGVFRLWAESMTDDEVLGYGAAAALRQMADERWRGRTT